MTTAAPALSPTPKQRQVIRAIKSRKYRYILTGGAISTAKTYGLALIFLSMAVQFAGTRYGIFRRNRPTLKRTTYQTFLKVARRMGLIKGVDFKINLTELYWEFPNGSQIWFCELDETKDPEFNKAKGLELTAAGIDEANEVTEEAFRIVSSRVGRENTNGEVAFVLLSCNPADNWVKTIFYNPWAKDELAAPYLFIPSVPSDNPYNSAEYLAALYAMPPQFLKRYVEGNWEYIDDANALFSNRVIERATKPIAARGQRYIGADISREGADRTVFAMIENGMIVDLYEPDIDKSDDAAILNQVADELIRYMERNKVGYEYVSIDAVGLGSGVLDNMRSRGYYIKSFKSGATSTDLDDTGAPRYDMLRSERYWKMAKAMESGELTIWKGLPCIEELRRELLAHKVDFTDKQIKVESKKMMHKRLQRSPDYADAVAMAFNTTKPTNADDIIAVGSYDDWENDDE